MSQILVVFQMGYLCWRIFRDLLIRASFFSEGQQGSCSGGVFDEQFERGDCVSLGGNCISLSRIEWFEYCDSSLELCHLGFE